MIRTVKKQEGEQLTAREVALAGVISRAIQNVWQNVDEQEIATALRNLNASQVNDIVSSLSISPSDAQIIRQLTLAVRSTIGESVENVRAVLRGQNRGLPSRVRPLNARELRLLPASELPQYLQAISTSYSFNYTDPRAILYASTRSGSLITAIDESTRLAIRQTITRAFTDQITVNETAKILRDIVGLHPRWANAVYNYRIRMINNLETEGLTTARATNRADQLSARYRKTLVRARANMIARTEIQLAQNQGRYLGWQQAFEQGLVAGETKKMWLTAPRDVCDICLELSGKIVGWNQAFANGNLMPPAHPNCRCVSVLIPPDRGTTNPPLLAQRLAQEFVEDFE